MLAKLLVLATALGITWVLAKLLGKIGRQNAELAVKREAEARRKAQHKARNEANIIDLVEDPKSGTFKEKS